MSDDFHVEYVRDLNNNHKMYNCEICQTNKTKNLYYLWYDGNKLKFEEMTLEEIMKHVLLVCEECALDKDKIELIYSLSLL